MLGQGGTTNQIDKNKRVLEKKHGITKNRVLKNCVSRIFFLDFFLGSLYHYGAMLVGVEVNP